MEKINFVRFHVVRSKIIGIKWRQVHKRKRFDTAFIISFRSRFIFVDESLVEIFALGAAIGKSIAFSNF